MKNLGISCIFTLLELLITISIIAVLVALLLPGLYNALERGKRMTCANNLRQTGILLCSYADDYEGYIPPNELAGYTKSPTEVIYDKKGLGLINNGDYSGIFGCPLSIYTSETCRTIWDGNKKEGADTCMGTAYIYRETCSSFNPVYSNNSKTPAVTFDEDDFQIHKRKWINILFYDGHVKGVSNQDGKYSFSINIFKNADAAF